MIPFRGTRIGSRLMVLLVLFLAACGTSHTYRYYTLSPVPAVPDEGPADARAVPLVLAIGPVSIPDYLDRPQIVTRTSRNELVLSEYSRWAGSLANDSARVLEENLEMMLSADGVAVVSWRRGVPNDYRVAVQISRFDALERGSVVLKAQWILYGKGGKRVLSIRESDIRVPMSSSGDDSAVEAMGKALAGLGREIVQGFRLAVTDEVQEQQAGVIALPEGGVPVK
jgi:uncharacterized lipoprotein YmbA